MARANLSLSNIVRTPAKQALKKGRVSSSTLGGKLNTSDMKKVKVPATRSRVMKRPCSSQRVMKRPCGKCQVECKRATKKSQNDNRHWADDWELPAPLPVEKSAGICFFVDKNATEKMYGPCWAEDCTLDTGPMRVRIVGDIPDLGLSEDGSWDPQNGVDLCWEGKGWRSLVYQVAPQSWLRFCVVRLDQSESHPGVLQGWRRSEVHDYRKFTWSSMHTVVAPDVGQIAEVRLDTLHCRWHSREYPETRVFARNELVLQAGGVMPHTASHAGSQRCYTFDGPDGVTLKFCLYLPSGYTSHPSELGSGSGWPLVVFLHSMHSMLDGDNNMFYESDTPLRLLVGSDRCPKVLQEKCIMLTPQCPADLDRPQGQGLWLRHGWYETSTYAPEMETALFSLIESICCSCRVDRQRVSVVGSSMGAYAALELSARRPGYFSAAGLIAAFYELDPMEPLVDKLVETQSLPLWFFHAQNDGMCSHADIERLVAMLRARSKAEIRFTSYLDTWSNAGHCADRVAFWARTSEHPDVPAYGDDFFKWLLSQQLGLQA
eukprot:TRINITY_DN23319_c0_g1_i1.p1 TRINITY_DN23319_c0_g1~~TRINITY_DN23319_c0_g1_i1.p1  ORF type:complete len:546 (-),score=18.73 TRINITY_DN23319_c0_g1_i1:30-1667(-)